MFTLGLFYVIVYLFIFLCLLGLVFTQIPVYIITHFSTTNFLVFLQKYSKFKNVFLFLIFSLTGLPPFGLFFVKFNILVFIVYQLHIFSVICVFFFFLFNMLYYIQLFNFKNHKAQIYNSINPDIISVWQRGGNYTNYSTYNTYKLVLFIMNVLAFLLIMVVTFNDFYFILSLI